MSFFSQEYFYNIVPSSAVAAVCLLITLLSVSIEGKPIISQTIQCHDNDTALKQQWIEWSTTPENPNEILQHESKYMLPSYRRQIEPELNRSTNLEYIYMDGASNENCPVAKNSTTPYTPASQELKDRSTCPYVYVVTINNDR